MMSLSTSNCHLAARAVAILLLTWVLGACGAKQTTDSLVSLEGLAMGTSWSVKVAAPPPSLDRSLLGREIAARIESIEQSMSTYRSDSELSRFNQYGGTEWFEVTSELCLVVEHALAVSRQTGGAFDVTIAPLVDLWGFGAGESIAVPPPSAAIDALRKEIGYEKLAVDCSRAALRKSLPGVHIDLSAIAKGFAVDVIAELLAERDLQNFFVEIGGEIRARGKNARNTSWSIAIESPQRDRLVVASVVHLADLAMATSGDYRNFFAYDEQYYSHTIDPRTGAPIQHGLASVSVVAASAMEADALATALLVLGAKDGVGLAEKLDLAVLFQQRTADGIVEHPTSAFLALQHAD